MIRLVQKLVTWAVQVTVRVIGACVNAPVTQRLLLSLLRAYVVDERAFPQRHIARVRLPTRRLVWRFRARQPLLSRQQLGGCLGPLLRHNRLVFRHDLQKRCSDVLETRFCCQPGVLWYEKNPTLINKFQVSFVSLYQAHNQNFCNLQSCI